jgi:hypothetical protein
MGKEARHKAKEYSWKNIARQMIVLYNTLTEEKNRRIDPVKLPSQRTRDRLSVGVHP